MENTCFEGCRYRDKRGKYKTSCPDYIELSWSSDDGKVKITQDCARRRSLLMMMGWDQRLLGVQRAAEQERNTNHALIVNIGEAVAKMQSIRISNENNTPLLP